MSIRTLVLTILGNLIFFYFTLDWFVKAIPIIIVPIGFLGFIWIPTTAVLFLERIIDWILRKYHMISPNVIRRKKILILQIVGVHVLSIFFGIGCNSLHRYYFSEPPKSMCTIAETTLNNTQAAISSYFSEPNRTELPTVEELVELEGLGFDKDVEVFILGDFDTDVMIVVTDTTGRCPHGKHYIGYMGKLSGGQWFEKSPFEILQNDEE